MSKSTDDDFQPVSNRRQKKQIKTQREDVKRSTLIVHGRAPINRAAFQGKKPKVSKTRQGTKDATDGTDTKDKQDHLDAKENNLGDKKVHNEEEESTVSIPAEPRILHPMERKWMLWIIPINRDRSVAVIPQKVLNKPLEHVEDFWSMHKQLKTLNREEEQLFVSLGTLYFMQDGFVPLWENSPDGGRWDYRLDSRMNLFELWTECALGLIGEWLVKENTDGILGMEIQGFNQDKLRLKLWSKGEEFQPTFDEQFPASFRLMLERPCWSENKEKPRLPELKGKGRPKQQYPQRFTHDRHAKRSFVPTKWSKGKE